MESTGKYWIPIFNYTEYDIDVCLTHPKYVKAIKGKKTDKKGSMRPCCNQEQEAPYFAIKYGRIKTGSLQLFSNNQKFILSFLKLIFRFHNFNFVVLFEIFYNLFG